MFMHVLYFGTFTDASVAEEWLKANLDGIASITTHDYEPYMCKFYTAFDLTESQQESVVNAVKPTAVMMNEEL
jgi:hypothetical protein